MQTIWENLEGSTQMLFLHVAGHSQQLIRWQEEAFPIQINVWCVIRRTPNVWSLGACDSSGIPSSILLLSCSDIHWVIPQCMSRAMRVKDWTISSFLELGKSGSTIICLKWNSSKHYCLEPWSKPGMKPSCALRQGLRAFLGKGCRLSCCPR
jgi:hypothetical protein